MDIWKSLFHPLEAQADRENAVNRAAKDSSEASLSRYFASINGNFLVTGDSYGMDYYRRRAILSALVHHQEVYNAPTIIFTSDNQLEAELISASQRHELFRKIIVISDNHPEYHFFYGMDGTKVHRCICDIARNIGVYDSGLHSYAQAFINVVSSEYPVSLPAMLNLAVNSNELIVNCARNNGLTNAALILKREESSWSAFRTVLHSIQNSVANLMSDMNVETEFTLRDAISENRIVLIKSDFDSEILRNCIAYELNECAGLNLNIIVDGVVFSSNSDIMWRTIQTVSSAYNNVLALTSSDVMEMIPANRISGFGNQILLQCTSDNNATVYLSQYGSYHHAYVEFDAKGKEISINHIQKLRIEPIEMRFAVLKGHLGNTLENTFNLTE